MKSIVGNDALKSKLCFDLRHSSLSHAYIIEGREGSGRHSVAYLTAAALSCENREKPNADIPCMVCPSCRKILSGKSPDVITIGRDSKASVGVDTVRFLRTDIHIVPNECDYKIYVIEDADTMTLQAQNAFLLSFEEPPSYVKFFLICRDADSLLETIRSRAQLLRTEPLSADTVDRYLCETDERARTLKALDPFTYGELLMASEHCIGRALEYLDPKKFKPVADDRKTAREFVSSIAAHPDKRRIAELISRFDTKREVVAQQLSNIGTALRDVIVLKKSEHAPLCFYRDRDEALSLGDLTTLPQLIGLYDAVNTARDEILRNSNIRLSLIKLFAGANLL